MAEQEACTALVDEATRGEEPKTPTTPPISGHLDGESQLLPLLQGLLDAPANDVTPDSGTESGEDQRSNLIAEVQSALEKLSNSLQSNQTDITAERRSSLLQLVTKLQAGLSGSGKKEERRASTVSTSGRFQKKKNKQARHTVGVSKEELADARKLIEQIALNELTPSGSVKLLSKQNSESSVPSSSYRNVHNKVKNAVAKPFSSSNSTSSSVQTPTEPFDGFDALFNAEEKKLERNTSVDSNVSIKSAYKAVQNAAVTKVKRQQSNQVDETSDGEESSTIKAATISDLENASTNLIYKKPSSHEDKSSRFDTQKRLRMKRANTIDIPKNLNFYEDEDDSDSEHDIKRRESSYALRAPLNVGNPQTKKIVPTFEPKTNSDKKFLAFLNKHNDSGANKGSMWSNTDTVWNNRFGNIKNNFEKKSSQAQAKNFWKSSDDNMKPLNGNQFGPKISRRSARNLQQMFEEKQKEIQRNIPQRMPNQYGASQNRNAVHVATDQYNTGIIQNHKIASQPPHNVATTGTSQDHYKPGRDAVLQQQTRKHSAGQHNIVAGSNQNRNTVQQQHVSPHNHITSQQNVVTGTLQLKTEPEKHYRIIPQPLPVNQFSHAPQSAFQPIKKTPQSPAKRTSMVFSPEGNEILKSEIKDNNGPSFLYSPKPLGSSVESSTVTSPVVSKPWAASAGTSRVLSMAASRFEQPAAQEPPKPKRITREAAKVFVPTNNQTVDRSPTYLPSKSEHKSSTVRKLSGNYENYDSKLKAQPQTYQIKTTVVESQYTPPVRAPVHAAPLVPPQNYSIRYDQPQNYSIRYDQQPQNYPQQPQNYPIPTQQPQNYSIPPQQPQNYHQPQNYSIRYDQPQNQYYQQQNPATQNYSIRYNQPQPVHSVKKVAPQPKLPTEFTSKSQKAPPVQAIEPVVQPPKAQRQTSEESVHEHIAVSSRVMSGPVSQQAVTVRQKSPMNRDQHDMDAAFSLKNSLQKVTPKSSPGVSPARSPVSQSFSHKPRDTNETKNQTLSQSFKYKSEIENSESVKYKPSDCPKPTVSPSSFRFKSTFEETPPPKNCGVVKPMQQATPIYNNTTNKPTNQFHIPMINVKSPESPRVLSKSDSWHDICLAHQNTDQRPVPKPGPVKSKSSHSLALPKLFEAGMSKEEMLNKRRTMEAFLTGNKPCETETVGGKSVKRSINRVKTSQKVSTQSRAVSGGLSRSRTLPDMICPELLDESNVDKAFDQLFESS